MIPILWRKIYLTPIVLLRKIISNCVTQNRIYFFIALIKDFYSNVPQRYLLNVYLAFKKTGVQQLNFAM